jgi:hypothetical protein
LESRETPEDVKLVISSISSYLAAFKKKNKRKKERKKEKESNVKKKLSFAKNEKLGILRDTSSKASTISGVVSSWVCRSAWFVAVPIISF